MNQRHNSARVLTDLVSVGGWRTVFDCDGQSTVHVDVVFKKAHYGSEEEAEIQFTLEMTRAEIVLIIPNGEPISVVDKTIARLMLDSTTTEIDNRTTERAMSGDASMSTSLRNLLPTFNLGLSGNRSVKKQEESRSVTTGLRVQHQKTRDGLPCWEVTNHDKALRGSPWDAAAAPRLKLRRTREQGPRDDQPVVRIEVRCRREDLRIDNLKLKNEQKQKLFQVRSNKDLHIAAAEQFIVDKLCREGLHIVKLGHEYNEIIVADVILYEE